MVIPSLFSLTSMHSYLYCISSVATYELHDMEHSMNRTTVPNDSFSPESGGNVNPNNAMEAISTHGTIKLKK